ncbi:MAG: hypothetical protein LBI41_00215 [Lactobacillales bacterium]|jgi:hypothetical protein|nr:hypothetical protein [Lactobacillales bacterium]
MIICRFLKSKGWALAFLFYALFFTFFTSVNFTNADIFPNMLPFVQQGNPQRIQQPANSAWCVSTCIDVVLASSEKVAPSFVNGLLSGGINAQKLGSFWEKPSLSTVLSMLPHLTPIQLAKIGQIDTKQIAVAERKEFLNAVLSFIGKNRPVQDQIKDFLHVQFDAISQENKADQIDAILSQLLSQYEDLDELIRVTKIIRYSTPMSEIQTILGHFPGMACKRHNVAHLDQAYRNILRELQAGDGKCLVIIHFANVTDTSTGGHACVTCGFTDTSIVIYNPDPAYTEQNPYDVGADFYYIAPSGVKKIPTEYCVIRW